MKLSEIQVKEIMARMETLIARKGMKKKDFYAASGISSSLYSQWNTGTVKPSLRLLAQAAETLVVEVDALINGKKEAPSEVGERVAWSCPSNGVRFLLVRPRLGLTVSR